MTKKQNKKWILSLLLVTFLAACCAICGTIFLFLFKNLRTVAYALILSTLLLAIFVYLLIVNKSRTEMRNQILKTNLEDSVDITKLKVYSIILYVTSAVAVTSASLGAVIMYLGDGVLKGLRQLGYIFLIVGVCGGFIAYVVLLIRMHIQYDKDTTQLDEDETKKPSMWFPFLLILFLIGAFIVLVAVILKMLKLRFPPQFQYIEMILFFIGAFLLLIDFIVFMIRMYLRFMADFDNSAPEEVKFTIIKRRAPIEEDDM